MRDENAVVGQPMNRIDGALKVSGQARYAADCMLDDLAFAVIVPSTVARGRIARIDTDDAERAGAIAVLTHRNAPRLPERGLAAYDPPAGRMLSLLQDDVVHYNGEPIAVVVADTFECAVDAAARVRVSYEPSPATLDFAQAKRSARKLEKEGAVPSDVSWGDFDAGAARGDVRIDAVYTTPMEHHNPIEPHATVALWIGDKLTLYDATQYVCGVREIVAKTLGIDEDDVRVVDPYVGGGFGGKGSAWSHVVLAAMASKHARRPVTLALARPQMFGPVGGRPQTEQHVVVCARRDGTLTALRHDVVSHTSGMEEYLEPSAVPTRSLYACENAVTTHRIAKLDVGVPTYQRAPGESTGTFAIESAMDELACALDLDPVQLRLRNYAEVEPHSGKPWSSKRLRECYRDAAERFGWSRRSAQPRSMRDGHWLVGWGTATATYPGHRHGASALARLLPDGSVLVQSATHDLGTGTYTVMTQVAAEALGVPPDRVRFELGDSAFPAAPISGGSSTVASVAPAVQAACASLRDKVIAAAAKDLESPLSGLATDELRIDDAWIVSRRDPARREALAAFAARRHPALEAKAELKGESEDEKHATRSFGAVFADVRVDADLGIVRVPRIVATYSVGRVLNAKTARSQLQGGVVWGVAQALFEESLLDPRYGRFANGNLAEYHVPVNADIGAIDVTFVDENDTAFNPLGARGIGEIGVTGVAAAIANAVYHATGKRVRDLPIRLDELL